MKKLLAIIIFGLFSACVSMPPKQAATKEAQVKTYNQFFDKVWEATLLAVTDIGFTPEIYKKEEGTITTAWRDTTKLKFTSNATYAAHKGAVSGEKTRFIIKVKGIKNTTEVRMIPYVEHDKRSLLIGTEPKWERQESNGLLEKDFFEALKKQLGD